MDCDEQPNVLNQVVNESLKRTAVQVLSLRRSGKEVAKSYLRYAAVV